MDIEEFKSIVSSGEGKKVEFKSSQLLRNPNGENKYKIAKEIVALANRRGGYLIFGVKDESGEIEEYDLLEEKSRETISSIASDRCSPPIDFDCYQFDSDLNGKSQAFVVEVNPKEQFPHAIIENSNGEIRKREYRIRAGENSRLVTDSELYSLFRGYTGQRIENGSAAFFPIDLIQQTPKYVDPYPDGFQSFDDFFSEISSDEWDWIINGGDGEGTEERVQKLAAELFPFAVLDSLPTDFWVRCLDTELGEEDIDDMFDYFGYITGKGLEYNNSYDQDPDLLISEMDVDPFQNLKENGWSMHIPKGTDVRLGHIDPYNSYLSLEKEDIFTCNVGLGGFVPEPIHGIHEKHPLSDLVEDEGIFSATLTIDVIGEFGYPDIEDSHLQEHQIYVENLCEMLDRLWDWDRCLNEASSMSYRIDHKLEGVNEKIDRLLEESTE